MAEGDSQDVAQKEKMDKEDMIEVLTSTGKIRSSLAGSLYDQGLDDPEALLDADEAAFTQYKGVGPKTAAALVEIAELKRKEMEDAAVVPDIREILSEVPRITKPVIENLIEAGYVDLSHFECVTDEDLREINGVGPKLSTSIIETVQEAIEKYGAEPVIEDATAEAPSKDEEEEVEGAPQKGIIDKIIDGIKSIFGGGKKKEEEAPEEEKVEAPQEDDKEEKAPAEETDEAEKEDEPSEDEKADEPEEEKAEVPEEEPSEIEEKEAEVPEEEPAEEQGEETEVPEEEPVEEEEASEGTKEEEKSEEEPKPSILDKIMGFFKGSKKEDAKEEGVEKEEPEEEKEPSDEESQEPEKEEGADEQDKSPDEETGTTEDIDDQEKEEQDVIEAGPTVTEIEDVPGIGKKMALKLKDAGYMNVQELKEAVPEDLLMIEGIGEKTAEKICESVKEA